MGIQGALIGQVPDTQARISPEPGRNHDALSHTNSTRKRGNSLSDPRLRVGLVSDGEK